ncbi:MAG: O-antigen ligase family protein [Bacteroidota bacterium]
MKSLSVLQTLKKAPYALLILLSCMPILTIDWISKILLVFFVTTIAFNTKEIKENFAKIGAKPILINCGFYFVLIISLSYSPLKNKGLDILVRELSILLIPIALIYALKVTKKLIKIITTLFIATNIIAAIYLIIKLNLVHEIIVNPSEFFNKRYFIDIALIETKEWHPTFIALNNLISILVLIQVSFNTTNIYKRLGAILIIVFFFFFFFILNSRIILLLALLMIPTFILIKLKSYTYKSIVVVLLIASATTIFIASKNNKFGRIFMKPITYYMENFDAEEFFGSRYRIQSCSVELIKEKPIFGYGIGYEKWLLPRYCLEIRNFKDQYLQNYSSHNVYLSLLFSAGIFGLLPFLLLLYNNLRLGIRKKDTMYVAILVIFIICFLTENYFIRLNGIVLFTFINTYFYKKNKLQLD